MRIILLLFLFAIFSCQNKQNSQDSEDNFEFYPPNPDIAVYKKQFLEERIEANTIFNLPDLFKGSKDSIEIRIWPWEAFDWFKDVIIFKLDSTGWRGFHYNSLTTPLKDYDGQIIRYSGEKEIGDSVFVVKEIIPKCGWIKLTDSINFFQIKTLPTQMLIKNFIYNVIRDGDDINIEVATKKFYRLISYDNPESYTYNECRKVSEFIRMLQRQFGNDYYWPRQWLYSKHGKQKTLSK
jgi:hypothetical protein